MRIAVDVDGVMVEFQQRWAQLYSEYFDRYVAYEALSRYDALRSETHFKSSAEFFGWFHRAGGWDDMPWIPGARGGVEALQAAGHDVEFVTARPPESHAATRVWAADGPWWPKVPVVFEAEKWKTEHDLYIDDTSDVIYKVSDGGRPAIIFDQPWNRAMGERPGLVVRARGWGDVVATVNNYDRTGVLSLRPAEETA